MSGGRVVDDFSSISLQDKKVSEVFGEIVWLMTQDRHYAGTSISTLQSVVIPAILYNHFKLYYAKQDGEKSEFSSVTQPLKPVAAVLWASLTDEKFLEVKENPHLLSRVAGSEMKSGPNKIIVEVFAPFGGGNEILAQIKTELNI